MSADTERDQLIEYLAKANDAFDNTLLKLSGGALGLSFAFVRQFVGGDEVRSAWLLGAAWVLWIGSLTFGLWSHYVSGLAMEEAIQRHDAGDAAEGGRYDKVTRYLNPVGGLAFVVGVSFAVAFMICNI